MPVFMRGQKKELYLTLHLPYGFIFTENCQPLLVVTLEQGQTALREAMERNIFTADEAQAIETELVQARLPENMGAVLEVIKGFKTPSDNVPRYHFEICTECPIEIPHGYVFDGDGNRNINHWFDNLLEAMAHFDTITSTANFPVEEAIHLLQQMIKAGLPIEQPKIVHDGPREALMAILSLGGLVQPPKDFLEALGLGGSDGDDNAG